MRSFRTRFVEIDGRARRYIDQPTGSPSRYLECSSIDEALRIAGRLVQAPFDLAAEHPFRLQVLKADPDDHLLVFTLHHIAADAATVRLLLTELAAAYEGREMEPEGIRMADVATWLNSQPPLQKELEWWHSKLDGLSPLDMPADRPRPSFRSGKGARIAVSATPDLTERLSDVAQALGGTPFMALVACLSILLAKRTGQTDFAIGTPVTLRSHPQLQLVAGCLVETAVVRIDLSGVPTLREHFRRVRSSVLGSLMHSSVPFQLVLKELKPPVNLPHAAVPGDGQPPRTSYMAPSVRGPGVPVSRRRSARLPIRPVVRFRAE